MSFKRHPCCINCRESLSEVDLCRRLFLLIHRIKGRLRIHVDSALTRSPVENARIRIFDTGQPEKALEEIGTDTNGNSETVELPAPPIEYSMEPSENQPYSEYTFQIQGRWL